MDHARRLVIDCQERFDSFTPARVVEEFRAALCVLLAAPRRCVAECGKVRRGTVDRGLWGRRVGLAGLVAAQTSRLVLARELGSTRKD